MIRHRPRLGGLACRACLPGHDGVFTIRVDGEQTHDKTSFVTDQIPNVQAPR
jgi:hypothetical protein